MRAPPEEGMTSQHYDDITDYMNGLVRVGRGRFGHVTNTHEGVR